MRRIALAIAVALAALPKAASAQITSAAGTQAASGETACNGEVIVAIAVRTMRATELEKAEQFGVGGMLGIMYRNTSWDVVRRFLFVREGQRCSARAVRESERVLRAQPFLADARIRVRRIAPDSIQLDVTTEDEFQLNAGLKLSRGSIGSLQLGNSNIAGRAIAATLLFERGFNYRNGFGVRVTHHQAFGRRWVVSGEAVRDPLGSRRQIAIRSPFYTDLRPRAWYAGVVQRRLYYPLKRPDGPDVSLALRRTQWLGGIAWRIGRPERSLLIGPLAEGEHTAGTGEPVIVTDTAITPYTGPDFEMRDYGFRSVRVGGLVAARRVDYVAVRGFDALAGPQDLSTGIEVVGVAARSIASRSGGDRDALFGTSIYAGLASPRSLLAVQVEAEAARAFDDDVWRGAIVSARAAWYRKPTPARLWTMSAEFAAGWNSRVPLQVTLSDYSGGIRGFGSANIGGGARVVLRGDHRWVIPHRWQRADLGVAAFTEAGRLWASDAPFGETTSWQSSVGISILGATPRGSRRLWRVDLAVPLTNAGNPRRAEVRATVGNFTRVFWREPLELTRARGGALLPRILDPR